MGLDVLARGEQWVVVGKPSGLAVHRSALVNERDNVVSRARQQFGQTADPVHRLDRATSGCLLLSFDRSATGALHQALVSGRKRYVAFVRGRVANFDPIEFSQPLKDDNGFMKDAVTSFVPIAGSVEPRVSLIVAEPLTGRIHQIRRHLRDLSHPVLGDSAHGDTRVNRWWRESYGLNRLALHCLSLTLEGPSGPISVHCPLPEELAAFGRRLPWWDDAVAAVPELVA